jgi:hypothetical protein
MLMRREMRWAIISQLDVGSDPGWFGCFCLTSLHVIHDLGIALQAMPASDIL